MKRGHSLERRMKISVVITRTPAVAVKIIRTAAVRLRGVQTIWASVMSFAANASLPPAFQKSEMHHDMLGRISRSPRPLVLRANNVIDFLNWGNALPRFLEHGARHSSALRHSVYAMSPPPIGHGFDNLPILVVVPPHRPARSGPMGGAWEYLAGQTLKKCSHISRLPSGGCRH
ncbi:hypothetical protein PhaeoP97_02420 [Phaeobacter porticola]|uniref:Uncharacterized protein n=1 Tax=Phaeobacter porticola TaxID=1844006 RepID=A0A1L3I6N5_9RHOB|nr:hypothetical protein PhaeoP97_02420 [Phaeobacter porticola]